MECILHHPDQLILPRGMEQIVTWRKKTDEHKMHTKPEYVKMHQDGKYTVSYTIKWSTWDQSTTQPLRANIYRVGKEYAFILLHSHVTVCVNEAVNLNKSFRFDFVKGERVCIGISNLSSGDFMILNASFSVRLT